MGDKLNSKFYKVARSFTNIPIKLIFKPTVDGLQNIPDKPYILIGNHKSFWDIPLVAAYTQDNIRFMAKKDLFKGKLLGKIFYSLGAFPINRNGVDINSIRTTLSLLKKGEILGVFPEGTRNKTDNLILPFKSGIAKIAKKTNSLVVPFGISGNYTLKNNLKLNFGEAIDFNKVEVDDGDKLLEDKVKELILK